MILGKPIIHKQVNVNVGGKVSIDIQLMILRNVKHAISGKMDLDNIKRTKLRYETR